ncbi:UNVERIFIED_CONTAM: hypothetical protein Scaly_1607300 [Sesamum calycinum]|uniref:Gag/pol protein n=1 Tax=Sesamum calycinum TaxID=2727403 RepID=A0AAW2P9K1_9LAMI
MAVMNTRKLYLGHGELRLCLESGHYKPYSVQSEYVARTVDSKRRSFPYQYMIMTSSIRSEMKSDFIATYPVVRSRTGARNGVLAALEVGSGARALAAFVVGARGGMVEPSIALREGFPSQDPLSPPLSELDGKPKEMKDHGGGHRMAHGGSMEKRPDGAHDGEPKRIKRDLQGPLSVNGLKTYFVGRVPAGERLTFEKFTQWHEDNRKVCSIVLSSMSNEIQKQYERYEDVWSIMHRMKELYAVPDRNIRYVVTKAFFGARMIEGSSVREHGVMMLSLVEKLKDLLADLEKEETYIDVILQSQPPSYDRFIINYNMNGLEKSLHELINMLVQYEATIEKSAPLVLVGEVSTSKVKGKDAGREKRKKDEMSSTAASTSSVPVTPLGGGKGKGRGFVSQRFRMIFAFIAERRAIGRGSVLSSSPMKVKMRSRKAETRRSLRFSDSKAVAAKTRDLVKLSGDHARIVSM